MEIPGLENLYSTEVLGFLKRKPPVADIMIMHDVDKYFDHLVQVSNKLMALVPKTIHPPKDADTAYWKELEDRLDEIDVQNSTDIPKTASMKASGWTLHTVEHAEDWADTLAKKFTEFQEHAAEVAKKQHTHTKAHLVCSLIESNYELMALNAIHVFMHLNRTIYPVLSSAKYTLAPF